MTHLIFDIYCYCLLFSFNGSAACLKLMGKNSLGINDNKVGGKFNKVGQWQPLFFAQKEVKNSWRTCNCGFLLLFFFLQVGLQSMFFSPCILYFFFCN